MSDSQDPQINEYAVPRLKRQTKAADEMSRYKVWTRTDWGGRRGSWRPDLYLPASTIAILGGMCHGAAPAAGVWRLPRGYQDRGAQKAAKGR